MSDRYNYRDTEVLIRDRYVNISYLILKFSTKTAILLFIYLFVLEIVEGTHIYDRNNRFHSKISIFKYFTITSVAKGNDTYFPDCTTRAPGTAHTYVLSPLRQDYHSRLYTVLPPPPLEDFALSFVVLLNRRSTFPNRTQCLKKM